MALNLGPMRQQTCRIRRRHKSRIDAKPPFAKARHHTALRIGGHGTHITPCIGKKFERPLFGNFRVQLAQAARRRIARIGKYFTTGSFLARIQGSEIGMAHINLAAHFNNVGHTSR